MSSPIRDHIAADLAANTATEDPFISPDFHLRNRSLSSTSRASITSSLATCSSNAPTSRRRRSVWYWPSSDSCFRFSRLRAIPIRWFAILLCLVATLVIWRLPPPSTRDLALYPSESSSIAALRVLRPRDSAGSRPTDPEQWLNENSEDALWRNKRWWERSPTKPKAAIISLVRNEELEGIMQSMRHLEHHWNKKYQYPWIFFNEKPFSEEFKVP